MFQSFSPNMLKTYLLCPKKFYFKYVKNISMPVNDEIFELGKNIHAIASYYLKKENIDKMEKFLSEREKYIWEYLKNLEYFSYEFVNAEYNLSFRIGDYFFSGRLDALVKKQDEYYIIDYKTGSAPKNAKYDFQTIIYLLAVRAFFKTDKVNFVYIDLKNKTDIKIKLESELISEYEKKLSDIVLKIKTEDFSKIQKDCRCEYNIICF
ncbi:PD-(D/E)XK nuclease family protein [bacterium]|nr:PD-(D/E)XK nuclease family protein [bacterium]